MADSKKHLYFILSLTCFLLAFLTSMICLRRQDEALAARLAPEVIRFHVLANSDSDEDQALKLQVRSLLLDTIQEEMGTDASIEETNDYIGSHLEELEDLAEAYMQKKGFDYEAKAELTNCYFPTKVYGDLVFPSGYYEALRISLGEGAGQNWWCVIYPALCFTEPARAVVPEDSKSKLQSVLVEDDYDRLKNEHRLRWSDRRPKLRLWSAEMLSR